MLATTTDLLAGLARSLGLPGLPLDETDTCAVLLDGDLHVDLHVVEDHDALCLCLDVGQLHPADQPAVLTRLLQANLTREGLGHAHLALCESGDIVALCRTVGLQAQSAAGLREEVERLAHTGRSWREALGVRASVALAQ